MVGAFNECAEKTAAFLFHVAVEAPDEFGQFLRLEVEVGTGEVELSPSGDNHLLSKSLVHVGVALVRLVTGLAAKQGDAFVSGLRAGHNRGGGGRARVSLIVE